MPKPGLWGKKTLGKSLREGLCTVPVSKGQTGKKKKKAQQNDRGANLEKEHLGGAFSKETNDGRRGTRFQEVADGGLLGKAQEKVGEKEKNFHRRTGVPVKTVVKVCSPQKAKKKANSFSRKQTGVTAPPKGEEKKTEEGGDIQSVPPETKVRKKGAASLGGTQESGKKDGPSNPEGKRRREGARPLSSQIKKYKNRAGKNQ